MTYSCPSCKKNLHHTSDKFNQIRLKYSCNICNFVVAIFNKYIICEFKSKTSIAVHAKITNSTITTTIESYIEFSSKIISQETTNHQCQNQQDQINLCFNQISKANQNLIFI